MDFRKICIFFFFFECVEAAFKNRKKIPTKTRTRGDTKHLNSVIFAMGNDSLDAFQLLKVADSKYSEFYLIIL